MKDSRSSLIPHPSSFGGTAVRVSGDPDPANNALHNNHLGSVSAMSDENGALVPGSLARYTPFGGWRTQPTAGLTDRGFTSHKSNNLGSGADNLGLIYMNARYYVPNTNRWLSPDTIVPDPTNPQSFNRYSYTRNNPINYIDPSGHAECYSPEGSCYGIVEGRLHPEIHTAAILLIRELEKKGYLENGHISSGYRAPADAHRFSTSYNIIQGNIDPDVLAENPQDLDGNLWFQERWAYFGMEDATCVNHPYGCVQTLENAAENSPETAQKGCCSCIKLTTVGAYCGPVTSYAEEGYPPGDPRRLPNSDDVPLSTHLDGLAVDIQYWDNGFFGFGEPWWDPEIDAIAAKYGLYRPFTPDTMGERAEWWHFEMINPPY